MSLLLDALKKSEAQRRRGSSPTIDLTRTPPSGASRRSGSRWLYVALVIVLLAAGAPWLWPRVSDWFDGRTGTPADVAAAAGSAVDQPTALSGETQAEAPEQASVPAAVAGASSTRRVAAEVAPSSAQPETTGTVEREIAAYGQSSSEPDARPEAATAPAEGENDSEAVSSTPESTPESEAVEASADAGPQMAELRRMVQARQQQARSSASEPAEDPTAEPAARANSPAENFIRPWELPQAQRAEFPDLRLTVHFFAEQPAERFVLINGERFTEGQRVGPGTRLVEIRQRGAVVEYGSYRVLIE